MSAPLKSALMVTLDIVGLFNQIRTTSIKSAQLNLPSNLGTRGRNRFDRCLLVLEQANELAGGVVSLKATRPRAAQEADAAIGAG